MIGLIRRKMTLRRQQIDHNKTPAEKLADEVFQKPKSKVRRIAGKVIGAPWEFTKRFSDQVVDDMVRIKTGGWPAAAISLPLAVLTIPVAAITLPLALAKRAAFSTHSIEGAIAASFVAGVIGALVGIWVIELAFVWNTFEVMAFIAGFSEEVDAEMQAELVEGCVA